MGICQHLLIQINEAQVINIPTAKQNISTFLLTFSFFVPFVHAKHQSAVAYINSFYFFIDSTFELSPKMSIMLQYFYIDLP